MTRKPNAVRRAATLRNRTHCAEIFSTERLHALLDLATDADWHAGATWYDTAHAEAVQLAERHSLSCAQAAGIIAALSPQTAWEDNLRIAELFCSSAGTASVHTADAQRKAFDILHSTHDPLTILGGNKVRSFYRNILNPDKAGPVTIDRHAAAILLSATTPEFNAQHKILERRHYYRLATAHYRAAAREYNVHPHQVQAIAWLLQSKRSEALPTF